MQMNSHGELGMKGRVLLPSLWCVSFFVVGVTLFVVSEESDYFPGVGKIIAADIEQMEPSFLLPLILSLSQRVWRKS